MSSVNMVAPGARNVGATTTAARRVAYIGSPGCYTEQAAVKFYHEKEVVELVPHHAVEEALRAVESGSCQTVILPIENTMSGTFHHNIDKILQGALYIVGEYVMHDDCCLMVKPGVTEDMIRNVLSHSHVLDRCERYLARLNAAATPTTDTASAASHVKNQTFTDCCAAIGSARLAQLSELEILARDVDDDNSSTRYILLGKEKASVPPGTGCKTTVALQLTNKPGTLFRALGCFAMRDINILKIENRPSARAGAMHDTYRPWEYVNLVDVEGNVAEGKLKNALQNLEEYANTVRVLGSYAVFAPALQTGPRSVT